MFNMDFFIGTSWHRVHLGFRYVANGDSGVWCINRINDVWYRNGTRVRDDKRIDGKNTNNLCQIAIQNIIFT